MHINQLVQEIYDCVQQSYAGMSERQIVKITDNSFQYRQFNAKFTKKLFHVVIGSRE